MPAKQSGQIDGEPGRYRLRWYDLGGKRHAKQPFRSKSDAREYFRNVVETQLLGHQAGKRDLTLGEFITLYLERHAANVRARTIATLAERLRAAERTFGPVALSDLEAMTDEIAAWQASQPSGVRYGRTSALRQVLGAAVRWGYISHNPAVLAGKNRQPDPRAVRVFSYAELDVIALELPQRYAPLPLSPLRQGCGQRSGRRLSARTSIARLE